MTVPQSVLRMPFPWYGGKSRVADLVWELLDSGTVGRYIEPFAGSLAVLLNRPQPRGLEIANDADGFVVNVLRALKHSPGETIDWADDIRTELDLTARHLWLVNEGWERLAAGLQSDPEWHDVQTAGWWLYGIAMWIGTGWCRGDGPWTRARLLSSTDDGRGVHAQLPHLGNDGQGVISDTVRHLCQLLSHRLTNVVITCGDFQRTLTNSALRATKGVTGVFLDPPYRQHTDEYASQANVEDVWQRLTQWCEQNGERTDLRIILCGYQGDWQPPPRWQTIAYTGLGTSSENRIRERIWASPSCLGRMSLLDDAGEAA